MDQTQTEIVRTEDSAALTKSGPRELAMEKISGVMTAAERVRYIDNLEQYEDNLFSLAARIMKADKVLVKSRFDFKNKQDREVLESLVMPGARRFRNIFRGFVGVYATFALMLVVAAPGILISLAVLLLSASTLICISSNISDESKSLLALKHRKSIVGYEDKYVKKEDRLIKDS